MRFYFAEIIVVGLDLLCAITAHAGACWCSTRGPFRRLYSWAFDIVHPMDRDRPYIADVPHVPPEPYEYVLTASGGVSQRWAWDGKTLRRTA